MPSQPSALIRRRATLGAASLAIALASCGKSDQTAPKSAVLTSVSISPQAQSVVAGQTVQFTAAPHDQSGNAITANVSWSSSVSSVASVSGSGLATTIAAGTTTIIATATVGGQSVQSSTSLTVTAVPVLSSVAVSAPSTSLAAGGTLQITATPKDQNGAGIAATVTYGSSATGVATVSASGLVTGVAAGTATITATATSGATIVSAPITITVTAASVLTSISVSAPSTSIGVGATGQFTASPKDQFGAAFTATVTWSSSAPAIATVSTSGLVTGVATGTTTITATATAGGQTVQSSTSVTVTAAAVLSSVTVNAPSTSLFAGNTLQLSASPKDQFGAAFAAALSWSSSAPSVATVSSSGLVTGVAAGTTTITASATAGGVTVTATVQISVSVLPLKTVTITAPSTSARIGNTIQLSAVGTDQSGGIVNASIVWSSSAPGIATVGSASGLVTGVAAGTATIAVDATANGVTVSSSVVITITATPVLTTVTISAPSSSVAVGSTLQFTASAKDQFGNAIASALTWSSSVIAKATINSSGLVTGVAAGSTNISVSATAGGVTVGSAPTAVTVTSAFASTASVTATVGLTFTPSSVDIAAGGVVTWTFGTTHNVTFNPAPGAPANIPDTPSGSVPVTFNTPGTFNYQCTIHAGMTGVVVVH